MTGTPGSATADDILDGHGSGGMAYRLEVEGWPCEWVSDERITHADGADGRRVFGGLSYEPFSTRERCIMHMSELQCDGVKFKITPPYKIIEGTVETDEGIFYLSREVDQIDKLAAAVAHDDTAFTFLSGGTYSAGNVLHIGTEAIRSIGGGDFDRAIWGTSPQAHLVNNYNRQLDVYVYTDIPPTMEGRRAILYLYGDGDDRAGDGRVIWRGMVVVPPQLHSDGTSWVIDCEPVTNVLNQHVAGAIVSANVIGIYHHYACPFVLIVHYDGTEYGPYYYSGHDLNEAEMLQNISAFLDSSVRVQTPANGTISAIDLRKLIDGQLVVHVTHNGSTPVQFHLIGGSAICGFFHSQLDGWQADGPSLISTGGVTGRLTKKALRQAGVLANEAGYLELSHPHKEFTAIAVDYTYSGAPVTALGQANLLIKSSAHLFPVTAFGAVGAAPVWVDPRPGSLQYSPWRIYVDTDMTDVDTVHVRGTSKPDDLYQVTATGVDNDKFFIEVEQAKGVPFFGSLGGSAAPSARGFLGYIGKEPIDAVRQYGLGHVGTFVAGLKTVGRDFANAGDTPFITDQDLEDFTPTLPISFLAAYRDYAFTKKRSLAEVLREELKFIGHFLRIGSDGRIGIAALPRWTETTPVDALHTLDGDSIITIPDAPLPSWTPNKDGRVDQVSVKHFYSFRENEHIDTGVTVESAQTIPITKRRGKTPLAITPFSAPKFYVDNQANADELIKIAKRVLDYFSINYSIVTLHLPYNKWPILCGDIVSITSPHVLAGDGTKGVTGRHGVVIEKRCNWDPRRQDRVELTVMLTSRGAVGYAPSALPTQAVDLGDDLWAFICPSTDDLNIALSTTLDGQVLKHFAEDDFVRIMGIDSYAPFELTGVVVFVETDAAPGLETIYIQFDGTFSPLLSGDDLEEPFIIEFQVDTGAEATVSQRKYCYSSAADGAAPDGDSYARRFG